MRRTFHGTYGPVIEAYCTLPGELAAKGAAPKSQPNSRLLTPHHAGKKLAGPIRTIYVTSPADGVSDAAKWVTEVQALVA